MQRYIKIILQALLLLPGFCCFSQALRDINYSYIYNPDERMSFVMNPVRLANTWKINYTLQVRDVSQGDINDYEITWLSREALNSKEDGTVNAENKEIIRRADLLNGAITIPFTEAPQYLVAKVVHRSLQRAYLYHTFLESNYPVNNHLLSEDKLLTAPFIITSRTATMADSTGTWTVSFYNDNFPAAAPAFSEGQAKVKKAMEADSVFTVTGESVLTFAHKGLYLFQRDTMASEGFALRAEDDYPRYSLVQNLPGPLIYICTKQEYDRLEQAKGDKKAFDRTVLSMTGDPERARKLIRNYFKRVELANLYFTSFKEGWKTDRGMIYIIFGLPDEVALLNDREVWTYDNEAFDITFNFTKASTIFDPDNYVLIRERKFQTPWYEVIELWRNARF